VGWHRVAGVHVDRVVELLHQAARATGRVLDQVATADAEGRGREPAGQHLELLADRGRRVGAADQVAAGDVELVAELDDAARGRGGRAERPVERVDSLDRVRGSGGLQDPGVPRVQLPPRQLAGIAAIVVVLVGGGWYDPLAR